MRQTRVYLPLSSAAVVRLAATRVVAGPDITAYAVTQELERANPGADEEDLEYLALGAAAEAAATIREHPADRRVVLAADVEPAWVERPHTSGPSSQVRLTEDVPLRLVVSFHVDEAGAAPGPGEADLLWYDATELDEVARMFR